MVTYFGVMEGFISSFLKKISLISPIYKNILEIL